MRKRLRNWCGAKYENMKEDIVKVIISDQNKELLKWGVIQNNALATEKTINGCFKFILLISIKCYFECKEFCFKRHKNDASEDQFLFLYSLLFAILQDNDISRTVFCLFVWFGFVVVIVVLLSFCNLDFQVFNRTGSLWWNSEVLYFAVQ